MLNKTDHNHNSIEALSKIPIYLWNLDPTQYTIDRAKQEFGHFLDHNDKIDILKNLFSKNPVAVTYMALEILKTGDDVDFRKLFSFLRSIQFHITESDFVWSKDFILFNSIIFDYEVSLIKTWPKIYKYIFENGPMPASYQAKSDVLYVNFKSQKKTYC